jgi:hypothetical protein
MSGLHLQVWHAARLPPPGPMPRPTSGLFNPTLQGEKFDPHGAYVRRWRNLAACQADAPALDRRGRARPRPKSVRETNHSVRFNNLRIGYRCGFANPWGMKWTTINRFWKKRRTR